MIDLPRSGSGAAAARRLPRVSASIQETLYIMLVSCTACLGPSIDIFYYIHALYRFITDQSSFPVDVLPNFPVTWPWP